MEKRAPRSWTLAERLLRHVECSPTQRGLPRATPARVRRDRGERRADSPGRSSPSTARGRRQGLAVRVATGVPSGCGRQAGASRRSGSPRSRRASRRGPPLQLQHLCRVVPLGLRFSGHRVLPALIVSLRQDSCGGEVALVSHQDRTVGRVKRGQQACFSASKLACAAAVHVKCALRLPSAVNGAASSEKPSTKCAASWG